MISGYNTDVRHGDVILHVQTEDKGTGNPCIESLIYFGGRIVSRRRQGYRKVLDGGGGEAQVQQLMESQHRQMIDAIRGGELDEELAEMGAIVAAGAAPATGDESAEGAAAGDGPSLDQVILDYLSSEAESEQLVLVMDTQGELAPGVSAVLVFEAKTSHGGEPVPGTSVTARLISTRSEPLTLGRGTTDELGSLRLKVAVPDVDRGTAALIVHASSVVGGAEIKVLI